MTIAKRRALIVVGLLLLLAFGYTAGYWLAPPESPMVSRVLPQTPLDAPQPTSLIEQIDET